MQLPRESSKHDRPLVSIAVPVYNGGQGLRQTLQSLVDQDYSHIEIVISDNASEDETSEICREFVERDGRVRYYRNASLLPMYENWQLAFERCRGELFMWAAADDIRPPGVVGTLVSALSCHPDAVMAHGPILAELEGSGRIVEVANAIEATSDDVAKRIASYVARLRHPSIMHGLLRVEVVRRCSLRTRPEQTQKGGHYGQDYLFGLRVCMLGPLIRVNEAMLLYRDTTWRTSGFDDPIGTDARLTLRNMLGLPPVRRKKHWTLLLIGSRYLLETESLDWFGTVRALVAFWVSFWRRHSRALMKEICFQVAHCFAALMRLAREEMRAERSQDNRWG